MTRPASHVFDNIRGLLNAALIAKAQMGAATGSIERDLATQHYTGAVDEIIAELAVMKRSADLARIAEFLEKGGRHG